MKIEKTINERKKSSVVRPFEGLPAWQKAHELVLETYRYTRRFPKEENNGLTIQFRNAATEIAAGIAGSQKAVNGGKKMQLLLNSQSMLDACNYYALLSQDLSYGSTQHIRVLINEIDGLITERIKSVRNNMALGF